MSAAGNKLAEFHKRGIMLIVPKDAKPEEVCKTYDKYAATYDEDLLPDSTYPALYTTINTFLDVVGDSSKDIKIIDLGAGTGLAGVELKKHGFTNIDGLDVSPEMLKKAKEKDVYQKYICEALTEKRLDIPTGAYDVVLGVGAVTSGYIKSNAFDEILRLGKPGGYIIFTIRQDVINGDEYGYTKKFQQFVNDGKWKEVKKFLTDYVVGLPDDNDRSEALRKCYVMVYKVLKSE